MQATQNHKTTIILADDHPATIAAANKILPKDCTLLGIATTGKMAIDLIKQFEPEIAIVDITISGMSGFEVVRQLRQQGFETKIIFLTLMEDLDYVRAAKELGAGYVLKRRMDTDLPLSIQEAIAGKIFISPFPGL